MTGLVGALSSLINQVAHGKKRIVLTSHGKPKAALVSLTDVAALEDLPAAREDDDSVFREIEDLTRCILERRGGALLSPPIEDLYAVREDRGKRS